MRVAIFLTLITPTFAADPAWPQFRGPSSNPIAADARLPDRWSTTENVEWSAAIPGRGWSSPIVAGDRVFLTTAVTEGASKVPQTGVDYSNELVAELRKQGLAMDKVLEKVTERDIELPSEVVLHYFLYCLDRKSGAVAWKKEFYSGRPPGGRHRKNSFSSETPVTDGKLVYVFVANLGLYAYDFSGALKWKTALEANPIYLDFGTGGSPVLHGDRLLILSDNEKLPFFAAYDKRTGKQLWRTIREFKGEGDGPPRKSGWTTPFVWKHAARTEVVTVGPGLAISYDLEGKELWRMSGMSAVPVPSPFVIDDLLYVDGGMGRAMFAVRAGAAGDISLAKDAVSNGSVVWSSPKAGTYLPTPVAYQGGLYVLTEKGILTRLDLKTGKQSYKQRLDPEAGYFTSSPWAYNGRVFCLSEEGKTFVVEAGEAFKVLHANALDEMAQATPAIVGDQLLMRTETKLYSIRRGAKAAN